MAENRYAILIGNNSFPNEPELEDLRYSLNDITNLEKVLSATERGDFKQIIRLADENSQNIRQRINEILNVAKKDDLVVIYYSGHGKLNRAGKLYLAAKDTINRTLETTAVSVDDIRNFIDISYARKIILILDCCYSGAAGKEFLKGSVDEQLHLTSSGRGIYIMTASTGAQAAKESESDQCGIFTKHIVDGIQSGQADLDTDGLISVDELFEYVDVNVRNEGFQQPKRWDIDVAGRLVISKSDRRPDEEQREGIRARLLDMSINENLSDTLLREALGILSKNQDELSAKEKKFYALLETMQEKQLSVRRLTDLWFDVSRTPSETFMIKKEGVTEEPVKDKPKTVPKTKLTAGLTIGLIVATIIGWILVFGLDPQNSGDDRSILIISWFFISLYGAIFLIHTIKKRIWVTAVLCFPAFYMFFSYLLVFGQGVYRIRIFDFGVVFQTAVIFIIFTWETFRELQSSGIRPVSSLNLKQEGILRIFISIVETGNITLILSIIRESEEGFTNLLGIVLMLLGLILVIITIRKRLWPIISMGLFSAWFSLPFVAWHSRIYYKGSGILAPGNAALILSLLLFGAVTAVLTFISFRALSRRIKTGTV